MALFTLILEYDGGTYISQRRSRSAADALANYVTALRSDLEILNSRSRTTLANAFSGETPAKLEGIRNAWCCSVSVGNKFALLNLIRTAER
ncbi:MAG TPA: hypothetical protein VF786_14125 [Terriglobales bacterium]